MNKTLTMFLSVLTDIKKWPMLPSLLTKLILRAIEAISIFIFSVPNTQVQPQRVRTKPVFRRRPKF
ncbi:MAG: hypothetical protein ACI8YQ_001594 [Polaribacter sp.]|jgi:hypothetical protein